MSDTNDEEESLFKSKLYFDLKDAVNEVSVSSGAKEIATQSAKLVGKAASNVAIFSGKLGLKFLKELPNITAAMAEQMLSKGESLSPEQRAKLEEISHNRKK